MADGEGEGDPRESQATKQNGLSLSKYGQDTPSPNPSETSTSLGYSGTENGTSYGGNASDDSMDQEIPLDFSVKRSNAGSIPIQNLNNKLVNGLHRLQEHRSRNSHRDHVTSQIARRGSPGPPGDDEDDLPVIKTEAVSPPPRVNGSSPGSNGTRYTTADIPGGKIGEPQIAVPGLLSSPVLPAGAAGLLPILPPGMLSTQNLLNGLSPSQDASEGKSPPNGKSLRPFKAYAKDQLNCPPPFGALPALPQLAGLDMIAAQAMAANTEEMFSQYKQYVMALQEQLRSQRSPGGSSSSSSQGQRQSGMHSPSGSGQEGTPLPPSSVMPSSGPFNIPTSDMSGRSPSIYRNSGTRKRGRSLPDAQKDNAYWERRRKNNEAAKRSRDARRAKEDEIAIRAAFLEQENLKLRVEVAALKNETAKLRCMLYNS